MYWLYFICSTNGAHQSVKMWYCTWWLCNNALAQFWYLMRDVICLLLYCSICNSVWSKMHPIAYDLLSMVHNIMYVCFYTSAVSGKATKISKWKHVPVVVIRVNLKHFSSCEINDCWLSLTDILQFAIYDYDIMCRFKVALTCLFVAFA